MSEKPNDSPAFRLRPRAEPKSYYSIRLEYSANPAAFTRERPRSGGIKRRSTSTKSSYSRTKQQNNKLTAAAQSALLHHDSSYAPTAPAGGGVKPTNVVSKEELEREERHNKLQRDTAQSITTDTMISPFIQRIAIHELAPMKVYDQNYITLRIVKLGQKQQASSANDHMLRCLCCRAGQNDEIECANIDGEDDGSNFFIEVCLHGPYANESLLKPGKIINIAKFRTGPTSTTMKDDVDNHDGVRWVPFNVIVKYEDSEQASLSTTISGGAVPTASRKTPLIPFVSINDVIEQPTEPYVRNPDDQLDNHHRVKGEKGEIKL